MTAEQIRRLDSLAKTREDYAVIEIDQEPETGEHFFWVVNRKTRKCYEVDLKRLTCTCYDAGLMLSRSLRNRNEGKPANWVYCRHLLLTAHLVQDPETSTKYIGWLPEVEFTT